MSTTAVKKVDENKFEVILEKIVSLEETGVQFPKDYSPENAARAAWLILGETKAAGGKMALEVCTPASVANALLKMVTLGLNPIKKQCYFVPYGEKLECMPSYLGAIATAKRYGLKTMNAKTIHEGDDFEYTITQEGNTVIKKHTQNLTSLNKPIIGAYAVAIMEDGAIDTTIMTMEDIKKAWEQGATKGGSPAHKNFAGEMAKKSVIGRACKSIISTSDDSSLFDNLEGAPSSTEANVAHEIKEKANKKELSMDVEAEEVADDDAEKQRIYEEAMAEEGQSQMTGPGF